jgi:hypothetical protein
MTQVTPDQLREIAASDHQSFAQLRTALRQAAARIEELEGALRPFAQVVRLIDEGRTYMISDGKWGVLVSDDDFRQASRTLSGRSGG